MPKLHRFRLERKVYRGDKSSKHSESIKRRVPCQFSRLFQNSEITLPSELQSFIESGKEISDADFPRNNSSKIRVILKINESKDTPSCLTVNKNLNCVGLIDPTPSRKNQTSNTNIHQFPFDSIFTENDHQTAQLSSSVIDPILDFFKGKDACIFSFGNSGLGKTKTMIGSDQSIGEMGIIPHTIALVFKVIDQLKTNRRTRCAVRISALEIADRNVVRDLLTKAISTRPLTTADTMDLSWDKSNSVLSNQIELPAGSIYEAARILDSVFAARSTNNDSLTHLQLIIHLYQYKIDVDNNNDVVAKSVLGDRSKLYFLDLGSGRHGNDDSNILSLQGISKVILALYTSQRHIPNTDNVLTQLLKETLGVNTMTTMLVHISSKEQSYNDTLQIVQLASKLYRTRSKKNRSVGFLMSEEASSCSSSSSGLQSRRLRPHMGIGAARRSSGNSSASSELDLTSASELSCCETVIFRDTANLSESEKSGHRKPVSQNSKSVSSESDFVISDKESPKDFVLSPAAIRRRKVSPRTNARAWPSVNSGSNTTGEDGPELWVDGPNAVYKSDRKPLKELTSIPKESNIETAAITIPTMIMMSKETQCDDVWDSSSSLTDGSSHSNTLDRKDHRPLSDISECTEDTESNIATETDFVKMNIMNDIVPINEFEDLLESTFVMSPHCQDVSPRLIGNGNYYNDFVFKPQLSGKVLSDKEMTMKSAGKLFPDTEEFSLLYNKRTVEEKKAPSLADAIEKFTKNYYSASDSRRSSKSEQKEKKIKSKCKKCSKTSSTEQSTSLTSSSSTDFSRVTSWIQNVDNELKLTKKEMDDDVFLDNAKSYQYSPHSHHQSQPDITFQSKVRDLQESIQYQSPVDNSWMYNNHHYSLYSAYHQTNADANMVQSFQPQMTLKPHVLPHTSAGVTPAYGSPQISRHHVQQPGNISYVRHSVSATQPPLPPIPQQMSRMDRNTVPLISIPSTMLDHGFNKCTTLPHYFYPDSYERMKRNRSDCHLPNTAQYSERSITERQDIKSKEKNKKESKSIMSIILAPIISLRNKINKGKEKHGKSDNNVNETVLQGESVCNRSLEYQWSNVDSKLNPEYILSSPYHLVTPPKTSTLPTESSSHGSDSSSLQNRPTVHGRSCETTKQHKCRIKSASNHSKKTTRHRPTSSGYGSIIIKGDSELSSHNDSSSEYSISGPKVINGQKMRQSMSFSNCKSVMDVIPVTEEQRVATYMDPLDLDTNDDTKIKDIATAENLILQEKLRFLLNEERKIVIEYIETNRLRGIPIDVCVMNLTCFKGVDNFEIPNSAKRDECLSLIRQIDQEMEQLKQKLFQAQNHLMLITTFDSKAQL